MSRSTMSVDLIVNGDSFSVSNVDKNSEQDRKIVSEFEYPSVPLENFAVVAPSSSSDIANTTFDAFFQVLTESNSQLNLSAFLDPKQLQTSLEKGWNSYWALYAGQIMRINVTDPNETVNTSVTVHTARVVIDAVPTHVLEGLLAALLLIILVVSACTSSNSGLTKPPFSIGAQMSMLADSQLVELVRGQRSASEDVWKGLWVKLGWWNRQDGSSTKRYGVDVVRNGDDEHVPFL